MKKGWETKKLGDLTDLVTKGTTPTSIGYDFVEDGINFVKVESISASGQFLAEKVAHITSECHAAMKRSQLEDGDILGRFVLEEKLFTYSPGWVAGGRRIRPMAARLPADIRGGRVEVSHGGRRVVLLLACHPRAHPSRRCVDAIGHRAAPAGRHVAHRAPACQACSRSLPHLSPRA